jgi:uncharacterized protein (DUF2141 family)
MVVNIFAFLLLLIMNTGTVVVEVEGLRNTEGRLFISLYNNAEDFPEVNKEYLIIVVDPIPDKNVKVRFENIPYGDYAMAMFHDEDRSGNIKKNFLGIPKEGYCFSRNFKPVMSAPDFEDCSFSLKSDSVVIVSKVIY